MQFVQFSKVLLMTLLAVCGGVTSISYAESEQAVATVAPLSEQRMERLRSLVSEREQSAVARAEARKSGEEPFARERESGSFSAFRLLEGLLITLGVFFIGVWVYQKLSGNTAKITGARGRRIKVLERTPVAAKTALVLAEIDGRTVLMSVGSDRVSFFSDSAWLEGAWDKEKAAESSQEHSAHQP